jgi:hypothetical protein
LNFGLAVAKLQQQPRKPDRRPVSEPIPRGWLSLARLTAETAIDERTLSNWGKRWLIPRPIVTPKLKGRGSVAYYRYETVAIIRRLYELREETHSADDWLWQLWLEGHPVDIWGWAAERLDATVNGLKKVYPLSREVIVSVAAKVARSLDGRTRSTERLRDTVDFFASVAAGEPDAGRDLEGMSPIVDTLCKAGGLPSLHGRLRALIVEVLVRFTQLLSLPRLAEIAAAKVGDEAAAKVRDEVVEQVRRDWQAITRIAASVASVDWNAVLPVFEAEIAKVDGVRSAPPSWTARKTRRTRALPPPALVKMTLKDLHDFDLRARAFFILIGARSDPEISGVITWVLALAELMLAQLPKRNPGPQQKPGAAS